MLGGPWMTIMEMFLPYGWVLFPGFRLDWITFTVGAAVASLKHFKPFKHSCILFPPTRSSENNGLSMLSPDKRYIMSGLLSKQMFPGSGYSIHVQAWATPSLFNTSSNLQKSDTAAVWTPPQTIWSCSCPHKTNRPLHTLVIEKKEWCEFEALVGLEMVQADI